MAFLGIMLHIHNLSLTKVSSMTNHPHDHSNQNNTRPDILADIQAGKKIFEDLVADGDAPHRDENYDRMMKALEDASNQIEEERNNRGGYVFDYAEFIDACDHVVADQLSALKKEKISPAEFATRFNRWFTFCDAVINLGISCLYPQTALKDKEYEVIFKSLKIHKQFELTMLKPRNIKIAMRHKSSQVKEKYSWLAMPVLIIKDADGVEHEVAITPSPNASTWWFDVLVGFHGSYNWINDSPEVFGEIDEDDADYVEGDLTITIEQHQPKDETEADGFYDAPPLTHEVVKEYHDALHRVEPRPTPIVEEVKKPNLLSRIWKKLVGLFK
jgi:hypothetical protein